MRLRAVIVAATRRQARNVRLAHFVAGEKVEDFSGAGVWELMYFGHVYAQPSLI